MKSDHKKQKPLVILTAGGTGGHVYPAEAVAEELLRRGYRLMLVTDKRGQNNYKGRLGEIPNQAVWAGAIMGKSKWFKIQSLFKTCIGILQSMWIILKNRPVCVVGFGGYASFPCSMAALLLMNDLVIHEQNSVMSRTNRFLGRYATLIAASFKPTRFAPEGTKTVLTGMPIRQSISDLAQRPYNAPAAKGPFNLLVLGGSQGAKIFSTVVPEAIAKLDAGLQKQINLTQQCRKDDLPDLEKRYQGFSCQTCLNSFFNNMPELYAQTHLIISRTGASSVFEIAAAGLPSVLVPLPTAADDHQTSNAAEFKRQKAGIVIGQKEFSADKLAEILADLMQNPAKLQDMAANTKQIAITDAAVRLAGQIEKKIIRRK